MLAPTLQVGCRALTVVDDVQGARVPVHVLYPTTAATRTETFGPYPLEIALDAPIAGERLPLVAISHGTGGSPWVYRGLAMHLAHAGFVVAMIEHPGNSRTDNSLADTPANLANRPRHVQRALDAAYADAVLGPRLVPDDAAVIGHSLGGYTALAVAGGRPLALPNMTADGVAQPVAVERDPRVHALVLLAPALPWFMAPGALADVRAPLLVRTAELDEHAPPAFIERILGGLPADAQIDDQVVPGAGHFAFMSPFPPALAHPGFPPAQDPPGFDRAAYQPQLYAEVVAFLRASLGRARTRMMFPYQTAAGRELEAMTVLPHGDLFELEDTPFYVQDLAHGDLVEGRYEADELRFVRRIQPSGSSTIRVIVFEEARRREVCALIEATGCLIEVADIRTLLAVDVPPDVDWQGLVQVLEQLAEAGVLDWEASAVADQHRA